MPLLALHALWVPLDTYAQLCYKAGANHKFTSVSLKPRPAIVPLLKDEVQGVHDLGVAEVEVLAVAGDDAANSHRRSGTGYVLPIVSGWRQRVTCSRLPPVSRRDLPAASQRLQGRRSSRPPPMRGSVMPAPGRAPQGGSSSRPPTAGARILPARPGGRKAGISVSK